MNIFNDATSTGGITLRTQNFQDASVVSNSVPVLGIGQAVGVQPISSYGLSLLNTDASALRTSLLTGVEEAVVYEANNTNEILFYTNLQGVAPTADKLRLKIADAEIHAEVPILVGSVKLEDGTAGVLSTTAGNKDMEIASHGTGAVVLRQEATEIINATPTTITTPMVDIKTIGNGANAINGIFGRTGKNFYIVSPQSKDLRLCVNGNSGDEDGDLAMNIGITKISVYKTIGVGDSGIDLGSSVAPFNNFYGNNLYYSQKAIGNTLRSEVLSPLDPVYQEIQFGLQPPVAGGSGLNEINFLFNKTDESTPPAGSTQAGTSVFRLTPTEASINVPLNNLEVVDTLKVSKLRSRDLTTNTHLLMNTNSIQLYTGSAGASLGTEHIRIEDTTGNNNINLLTEVKLHNNITLNSSINMASSATPLGSVYINQLFSNNVASYTANSNLSLTANGTGAITCNSNMSFANDKELFLNSNEGDKLNWDATSKVYTSPGELHFHTDRETHIWANSNPVLQIRNSTTTLGSHLSPTTDNDYKLGQINRRFTELYAQNVYNKSNIFYRIVDLPSFPTASDYLNVYTLDYFDSRPVFKQGITTTYDLGTIENMTNDLVWTSLDKKGMILDMTIVAPTTGTMYIRYTTDDGSRLWVDNTELVCKSSDGTTNTALWNNHGPLIGFADFSIVSGTEYRLRLQYVENSSGASAKLEWTTSARVPAGNQTPYTTDFSPIIGGNNLGVRASVGCENGYGKLSVKTNPSALSTGTAYWDNNYMIVGEADNINGMCVGIGVNTDTPNAHYGVIKSIAPSSAWRPLKISASSVEFDHQGTNKMFVADNIVAKGHFIPNVADTYDLGFKANRFRDTHTERLRIFGDTGLSGASIDLRGGGGYTNQAENQETPPIYFNTGWYSAGLNESEIRRSMIIGTNQNRPTGEIGNGGRNNIAFCCYGSGGADAVGVDISHEKFRVGQLANYTSVDILPRNTTCDLANTTFPFAEGHINTLYANLIDFPDTFATKLQLHGTSYSIGVSDSSLDIFTGNKISMKSGTTFVMKLDSSMIEAYRHIIPSLHTTYDLGSDTDPGDGAGNPGQASMWFRNGFFSNVYGQNVLITSDRNMKEDIIDLPIGLDYIRKLRPKQYKYKGNTSGRRHWGLIAQDVREINQDDMISSWGLRPSGTQQLNYTEFIAPLIKAVQQLDTKVERLSHTAGHKIDTLQQQPTHYANDTTFIDEARLDIIEERVAEVEKYGKRLSSLEAHEDSIVDSEGSPDNMELAMNSIHALEQRVLKLERANKRLTTAVNKLLKQSP